MDNSDFHERFNEANKSIGRYSAIMSVISIIMTLAMIAVIGVGIYLAIKNWG